MSHITLKGLYYFQLHQNLIDTIEIKCRKVILKSTG